MASRLPEVRCGLFIEADFDDSGKPGFEMRVDVKYRNLPAEGLTALEKETAALIDRMAEFGKSQSAAAE